MCPGPAFFLKENEEFHSKAHHLSDNDGLSLERNQKGGPGLTPSPFPNLGLEWGFTHEGNGAP